MNYDFKMYVASAKYGTCNNTIRSHVYCIHAMLHVAWHGLLLRKRKLATGTKTD